MKELFLEFIGYDYSEIKEAANKVRVCVNPSDKDWKSAPKEGPEDEKDVNIPRNLDFNYILTSFMEKESSTIEKLLVNKWSNKERKEPSLFADFSKERFSGIVGVITGQMKWPESVEEDDPTEYNLYIKLEIRSRMDKKYKKPYFLTTLLLGDVMKLNNNSIPSNEDQLYDYLLLFWLKEQLLRATMKGLYKTYRRFEKNDANLRGSIDFARHIKENLGMKNGSIAYTYRENTINNYLNMLIIHAYEYLKTKYYPLVIDNFDNNFELKLILDTLKINTDYNSVGVREVMAKNHQMISHPFFTEYEELRRTCFKILRDEGASFFDGSYEKESQGILVYLPTLWENYLEKRLQEKLGERVESQKKISLFGSLDSDNEYRYKQSSYPDFIFNYKKDGEVLKYMVLDAKFKPGWEKALYEVPNSISGRLNDYDKAIRDMTSISGFATGVIFPTQTEYNPISLKAVLHKFSEMNTVNNFYTIPVIVPDNNAKGFEEWLDKFKKSTEHSIAVIQMIAGEEERLHSEVQELMGKIALKRKCSDFLLAHSLKKQNKREICLEVSAFWDSRCGKVVIDGKTKGIASLVL